MTVQTLTSPRWNDPLFASAGSAVMNDLSALGAHYQNCQGCKGRWFAICCAAEAVHSFVAPRIVTTLVAVAGVVVIAAAAL